MDFKSQLQELVQRDNAGPLEYKILMEKGPAHNQRICVCCIIKWN